MSKEKEIDRYTVGKGIAPDWFRRRLMHYRKADGSTGYEWHGVSRNILLSKGDKVIRNSDGKISFRKERGQ